MTFRAIYENGVFRPLEPVTYPEQSVVTVHVEAALASLEQVSADSEAIWAVLEAGASTGDPTISERHDEHQP